MYFYIHNYQQTLKLYLLIGMQDFPFLMFCPQSLVLLSVAFLKPELVYLLREGKEKQNMSRDCA